MHPLIAASLATNLSGERLAAARMRRARRRSRLRLGVLRPRTP